MKITYSGLLAHSMNGRVQRLKRIMRGMPQIELKTDHFFADGMYCRVVERPKGAVIVGKTHKKAHFYIVVKGAVRVTSDEGVRDFSAPAVIVSQPGTQRAVVALEDSVCLTVHRTDNTDLDAIECELVKDDGHALFNSLNQLKAIK